MKKSAFTLIEMLIVVGVLALLLGLLSPAILKSIKAANEAKQTAEQRVLAAAIIEYWHDNKKWPIGNKDPYRDGPKKQNPETGEWVFTGEMVFSGKIWNPDSDAMPNSIVFDELYKATFNNVREAKTYFDVNNHITTARQSANGPVFGVSPLPGEAPLKDILGQGENAVGHKTRHPIFCYWGTVFRCPHNHENDQFAYYRMDASKCTSEDCQYFKSNGFGYTFKSKDKSNGAKRTLFPYRVTIDFYNDTAIVSKDY